MIEEKLEGPKGTEQIMLDCGCMSMSVRKMKDGSYKPSCIIHNSITPMKDEPDLGGRRMRCDYFGKAWGRNAGPIYPQKRRDVSKCSREHGCQCEYPSDSTQPFFMFQGESSSKVDFSRSHYQRNIKDDGPSLDNHQRVAG